MRFLTEGETELFIQREREIPHRGRNRVCYTGRKRDSSQMEKQSLLYREKESSSHKEKQSLLYREKERFLTNGETEFFYR